MLYFYIKTMIFIAVKINSTCWISFEQKTEKFDQIITLIMWFSDNSKWVPLLSSQETKADKNMVKKRVL